MNSGNRVGLLIKCEKANYNFISDESIIISSFRKQYEQFHLRNLSLNIFHRLYILGFNFSIEIINLKLSKCRITINLIQRSQKTRFFFFWYFIFVGVSPRKHPWYFMVPKMQVYKHMYYTNVIWYMVKHGMWPSQWYNVPNKNLLPNVSSACFKS